jgi:hypothetical protein
VTVINTHSKFEIGGDEDIARFGLDSGGVFEYGYAVVSIFN